MTAEAARLRCPACGANVAPDVGRCPYCQARLATISCPTCFALMFDGAAYCQQCGTRRDRSERESASAACPGCTQEMDRASVGGTTLLECRACDAVWLDAADFERICADSEAQAAVLHRVAPRAELSARARVKYRPCLRCGRMMNRMNFGQVSGTVVDVCRGHGTFLDAGELHAIVTFIRGGGLDRARQRRIDDLKEEERRLEWARTLPSQQGPANARTTFDANRRRSRGILDLLDLLKRE
jgi:Zn-finger nucleic acid-binding protein